ncbi:hypothetical protein A4X13_0g4458 [Tilletia indica]|uniref:Uncharacterized protein n=1 Tax=Tilletia indica TaxID=43049 RepID=A0A177TPF1_9BASI|nr:hypothetical protein A4X13_0g4458 [Tilletia indica]
MPRFNPNPSLADRFPGEIVLHILRNFMEPRPGEHQSLKAFVADTIPWQKLSWKFKLAIDAIIGMHFHTFDFPDHHGVHDDTAPWHVGTRDHMVLHRNYWKHYQGKTATIIPTFSDIVNSLTPGRLPALRCVSLDVRAMEPTSRSSLRLWKTLHTPRWVQTTHILSCLANASRGIEELNIRVSPQQDLLNIINDIVDRNKNLRIIRIDVDSTVVNNRNMQSTIRLDNMFGSTLPRAPLEQLIIRAPGCKIKTFATSQQLQTHFFRHLRIAKELVLACSVFNALLPTLIWTYQLLQHMPNLELGDIAVYAPDSHKLNTKDVELPMLHMHALDKLSLQIPEVDTHLLRSINALKLYKLRIKSTIPVSDWPICVDSHFPNLFIVNVQCPGPSALRLSALGIPHRCSYHNLGGMHNRTRFHTQPFLAYIKPYSCRRNDLPSPPPLPYPPPAFFEADLDGWDEEEDSEATVTTGSEFSTSDDEDHDDDVTEGSQHSSETVSGMELSDPESFSYSDSEMEEVTDVGTASNTLGTLVQSSSGTEDTQMQHDSNDEHGAPPHDAIGSIAPSDHLNSAASPASQIDSHSLLPTVGLAPCESRPSKRARYSTPL